MSSQSNRTERPSLVKAIASAVGAVAAGALCVALVAVLAGKATMKPVPVEGTAISTKYIAPKTVMKSYSDNGVGITSGGHLAFTAPSTTWYLETKAACFQVTYTDHDGKTKTSCVSAADFDSIEPGQEFATTLDRFTRKTRTNCHELPPGTCEQRVADGIKIVD